MLNLSQLLLPAKAPCAFFVCLHRSLLAFVFALCGAAGIALAEPRLGVESPTGTDVPQANQLLDNVSYLNPGSWNLPMNSQASRVLPGIVRAMMSDSGSIYFEAPVYQAKAVPDKFVARSPRNGRAASDGKILLREGALAPGLPRNSIKQLFYFTTSGLFVSGGGKGLIRATVQPDYGDYATKEVLYYNVEGTDTPVPIALAGDTISVGTGTKTITGFDVQSVWSKNVPTGPKPINDAGQVAVLVKCGTDRVAYDFNAPQSCLI
ncbi:MAG: hypothetical protein NTV80_07145 [Verrucomicrobia bacterium]|nr:hypothetical protein [Verrucomicrobiota bacterium]